MMHKWPTSHKRTKYKIRNEKAVDIN